MTYRHTSHLHGDYLDGDLSPEQRAALDRHIAECEKCRDDLEKLRRLKTILGQIESPDPGDEYFGNMLGAVQAHTVTAEDLGTAVVPAADYRHSSRHILKTLIRLAAAITLLFISFYISDFTKERPSIEWTERLAQEESAKAEMIDSTDDLIQRSQGIK